MNNYILMSTKTHTKYKIYTNFAVTALFDLEPLGIKSIDETDSLMMKIDNDLDDDIVIIKHNDNIHNITIHELLECMKKQEKRNIRRYTV